MWFETVFLVILRVLQIPSKPLFESLLKAFKRPVNGLLILIKVVSNSLIPSKPLFKCVMIGPGALGGPTLYGAVHQVIDHLYNRYANASTQEFLSYQEPWGATGTRLGPYESYHLCALFGH